MSDARAVERYLRALFLRAATVRALRAIAIATGVFSLTFAVAAIAVGPVAPWPVAIVAWVVVLGLALGAAAFALRDLRQLSGARAALLLAVVRRELASAARSVVELARDPRASLAAPELVAAHARSVRAELDAVPAARVVPLAGVRHPTLLAGLLGLGFGIAAVLASDRVASGVYALTHPASRDERGDHIAAVVGRVEARLVYPGYLRRPEAHLVDPALIEAPRGTSISFTIVPRITATMGTIRLGDREIRLARDGATLRGEIVIREDGELAIRLRDEEDRWLRDPARRIVRAIADEAPRLALLSPETDLVVEPGSDVPIAWHASDDVGLRDVQLVVVEPGREEARRVLAEYDEGSEKPQASGVEAFSLRGLEVEPGDSVVVYLEARDGDLVSGPNVGRSERRTLTIASEATRRARAIEGLGAVRDLGLDALADRLETEVPEGQEGARTRFSLVAGSTRAFADALESLDGEDAAEHRAMAARVARGLAAEDRLHGGTTAPKARRVAADELLVEELEKDVLALADLLGRARLEDAAAIARELEGIRREMASLLAELRRADTPEARDALMRAIARAQARLDELSQRIAQMGTEVPSDFLNLEGATPQETQDALSAMRDALAQGDLDGAERQLHELERQIDQLASALGGAGEAFAEARFGPRERALAEALDLLSGLEAEQEQLARRSGELRRAAAERAIEALGDGTARTASRLHDRAAEARRLLEQVPRDELGTFEEETFDRARQRSIDVLDALEAGDLGEARRMAEQAESDSGELARDLDLSSLMFAGAGGETADGARRARAAAASLSELRRAIDQAIPSAADYVDDSARRQMREDEQRQGHAIESADGIAQTLDEGPDGVPISPEGAASVREARESMERGRRALEHSDPLEASHAQEDAARRLTELREQLERERQQSQSEGGGSGEGEGGDGSPDFRQPVRIPEADEFSGPMERRQRLLDAMRERAPEGFEDAVRAYYEDLLR